MLLSFVTWAFVGLIVGLLARLVLPERQPFGLFSTLVLGISGSLAGGAAACLLTGIYQPYSAAAWPGWAFAIVGAVLVLGVATARGAAYTQHLRRTSL